VRVMPVRATSNGMRFERDAAKAPADVDKHGITFSAGALIFSGQVVESSRAGPQDGEERIEAVGEVDGAILAVVYTWRGDTRRIISVRRASR
jgi:uncharacterized DUF497 family protein